MSGSCFPKPFFKKILLFNILVKIDNNQNSKNAFFSKTMKNTSDNSDKLKNKHTNNVFSLIVILSLHNVFFV